MGPPFPNLIAACEMAWRGSVLVIAALPVLTAKQAKNFSPPSPPFTHVIAGSEMAWVGCSPDNCRNCRPGSQVRWEICPPPPSPAPPPPYTLIAASEMARRVCSAGDCSDCRPGSKVRRGAHAMQNARPDSIALHHGQGNGRLRLSPGPPTQAGESSQQQI